MNIVVVAAVVEQDQRFLVTRRQPGVHLAGMWEFPGGKIAPDESHDAALKRELREELDVGHRSRRADIRDDARLSRSNVVLYFYRCRLRAARVRCSARRCGGSSRNDLPSLGFPPADAELIERLVKSDVR